MLRQARSLTLAVGFDGVWFARPVLAQPPALDVMMNRRMRPIRRAFDVPVLHGIDMHVIDMALQIVLVADPMLPIPPLPNSPLAPSCA